MTTLKDKLKELKSKGKFGLMMHVVIGYPTLKDTIIFVKLMVQEGVDIIELQIPFSDPLADGPTIMRVCEKALGNGTKVRDCFNIMKQLSKEVNIPLLFMAYYNNVFKYGTEKFRKDAKISGASGLIVPDMPIEEEKCEHFIEYCRKYGLEHIRVISPASTNVRLIKNAKVANGFVYFAARQGITGAKEELDPNTVVNLKKLRKYFSIPIAVGFGISKKEHIKSISPYADIAVVGSAIIDIINKSKGQDIERNIKSFIKNLKMVN